jgi:hypothetical protein
MGHKPQSLERIEKIHPARIILDCKKIMEPKVQSIRTKTLTGMTTAVSHAES